MRKDVRLGFGVGGVLLACIIVAVLVVHRNKNQNKQVTFQDGAGNGAAPTDASAGDAGAGDPMASKGAPDDRGATAAPKDQRASGANERGQGAAGDGGPAGAEARGDGGDRWEALFASTADKPATARLTSDNSGTPGRAKTDKSAPQKSESTGQAANGEVNGPAGGGVSSPTGDSVPSTVPSRGSPGVIADPMPSPGSTNVPRTYKVQQGETFVSIARKLYGDSRSYMAIERANPLVNAERLRPGTVIQVPSASEAHQFGKPAALSHADATAPRQTPTISGDGKSYTVQKDDNLYKIARKLYGKGERGDEIYELNKDLIGPDRARLKLGAVLKLPQRPIVSAAR